MSQQHETNGNGSNGGQRHDSFHPNLTWVDVTQPPQKPPTLEVMIDLPGLKDSPRMTPQELTFLEGHKGFVPYEHPPRELGTWLEALTNPDNRGETVLYMRTDDLSARPLYHGEAPPLGVRLGELGVYNSYKAGEGQRRNVNLLHPDATIVHDRARETLGSGRFTAILPFANEAGTVGGVIRYAASRLGGEHVLAVDAGTDANAAIEASEAAQRTGAHIVRQADILGAIDWDALKGLGILPKDFTLKGAKGLTMYAGLIAAEAMGALDTQTVIFHDTDIVNAGPQDPDAPGKSGEYSALEHLALPFSYPVDRGPIHSAMILRTGAGRNNEPWLWEARAIAKRNANPDIRKLSLLLGSLGWPLSGERTLGGTIQTPQGEIALARALPLAVGMGVETHMNIALAGLDVKNGRRSVMQVANPHAKIESRESPRDREYGLIYGCANYMGDAVEHIGNTGRGIIDWTAQDVANFNIIYGGQQDNVFVPSSDDHHGNKLVTIKTDYVLPSMQQLKELGVVNWDRVQELTHR